MAFATFEALTEAAIDHIRQGTFAEGAALMAAEGDTFPEHRATVLYIRSCLAARMQDTEQALGFLATALDEGLWYGEVMIRQTPSWAQLQGLPAFETLAARSIALQQAAVGASSARLLIEEPATLRTPQPAFVSLHGNTGNGQFSLDGWRGVLAEGLLHAAIQSSQIVTKDAFVWDDRATADAEVSAQLAALQERYPIDLGASILAGFSMGGETALRQLCEGVVPFTRLLLLGPGGPITLDEPAGWAPLLERLPATTRVALLYGLNEPPAALAAIESLATQLQARVPTVVHAIPGIGHAYPEDQALLREALAFLRA